MRGVGGGGENRWGESSLPSLASLLRQPGLGNPLQGSAAARPPRASVRAAHGGRLDRSNRPEVLGGLNPRCASRRSSSTTGGRSPSRRDPLVLRPGHPVPARDPYERAQVLQWMFFEQYDHEPAIAVARFWLAYSGRAEEFADRLPERQAAGRRALDAMEGHLDGRGFLVGEGSRSPTSRLRVHACRPGGRLRARALSGGPAWLARVRRSRGTSRSTLDDGRTPPRPGAS